MRRVPCVRSSWSSWCSRHWPLRELLRPARGTEPTPEEPVLDALKPILERVTETQPLLAYLGDKAILNSADRRGFIMYQSAGDSLIAMGDPVGDVASRNELRWAFRELADRRGLNCVFYQIGNEDLERYLDLGLSLVKLGEEAIVDLDSFTLEGSSRASLRARVTVHCAKGPRFCVVPADELEGGSMSSGAFPMTGCRTKPARKRVSPWDTLRPSTCGDFRVRWFFEASNRWRLRILAGTGGPRVVG